MKSRWKIIVIGIGAIVIASIFWVAIQRNGWGWTGFGVYTGNITEPDNRAKTLWDWLGLLIVPAFLGFIALWFNQSIRTRENRISTDQQREEALQNYLDNIAELLLKENLLENKDNPDAPVVDVAQVRTITTLRLLDAKRRNILFQFLRDSKLADFILVGASLQGVDLSDTKMYGINLMKADLTKANLLGAHLYKANLTDASYDRDTTWPTRYFDKSQAKFIGDPITPARKR